MRENAVLAIKRPMLSEDLDLFFESDFSVTARIGRETVSGIFDEEYDPVMAGVEGRLITFTLAKNKVNSLTIEHGTELEIAGKFYEVIGVQPVDDGQIVDLQLKEVA